MVRGLHARVATGLTDTHEPKFGNRDESVCVCVEPNCNGAGDEDMTTKLTEPLRREIEIDGEPYTIQLMPLGIRLSRKRFRQGRLVTWRALWDQGELESADASNGIP